MPKRLVKQISWEVESERLKVTPAMERRTAKLVIERSEKALAELAAITTEEQAFYAIPSAATAAYYLGRFSEAEQLANKSIAIAAGFTDNWNHSNALHAGHTVLGLLALRNGDVSRAVRELHASGDIKGSPQLGSFGPTMQLARELLRRGEAKGVVAYLHQCRVFWKSGGLYLSIWEKKIMRGVVPNFLMNLYR